jgi:hypothetical protein
MTLVLIALLAQTLVAERAVQPQVAIDGEGRIHVAFAQDGNIAVATSTDGGRTFGAPVVAIDAKGTVKAGQQRGPRIGADGKGHLVVTAPVCFDESELAKQYPTGELWLTRSPDGGRTWSKLVQVNDANGQAPEALHWMAVAPDGDVHVAWVDKRQATRGQDLFYARVTGDKASTNVRIASEICPCCAPGLAVDAAGNPYVAIREGTGMDRAILLIVSKDGGRTFSLPAPANSGKTKVPN